MRAEMHIKTTVLPGGKIEIHNSDLMPGESVDVIVKRSQRDRVGRRPALDILADAPGHRLFKSADEVRAYLREEHDSWEH